MSHLRYTSPYIMVFCPTIPERTQTILHFFLPQSSQMGAPLSSWPWQNFGFFKYLLYGPLVAKAVESRAWQGGKTGEVWCFHLLLLFAIRGLVHQLWWSFSSMLFLTRKRRIIKEGIDFEQIDREWDWDNFLILQVFIGAMIFYLFPSWREFPLWDLKGLFIALLLHVAVSEPLFYWTHRAFHSEKLFSRYHSLHHSSPIPTSFTAGHGTPLEHLVMSLVMMVPLLGASFAGAGSVGLYYAYILLFDSLRCMGHSNVEVFPGGLFEAFPFLRYLIYTPTYHSLHHTEKNSNYCLFMPLFDALGGTLNTKSWSLQKEISSGKNIQVPDFVFLAHVVDVGSSLHVPFVFRSFSAMPFRVAPHILLCWPGGFVTMLMMWGWSKTFLLSFYNLHGRLHQYWVVPRYGFQYFLPFAKNGINNQIESAILRADKMGVKVLSLAALNKEDTEGSSSRLPTISSSSHKVPSFGEQRLAPPGTYFHQFVVPPIAGFRRDCNYGKLAAMRLPLDVKGLGMCEYTLERGAVHACHAGGLVHCLEGWTHHEVGAIDVDRIDLVWRAALKQGLRPA